MKTEEQLREEILDKVETAIEAESIWMFTIYDRPADFPEHYVVRRWQITAGKLIPHQHSLAATLSGARQHIPPGRFRLSRAVNDDPTIVETWI